MWKNISGHSAYTAQNTFGSSSSNAAENMAESSQKNEERSTGTSTKENPRASLQHEKALRQRILANVSFLKKQSPAEKMRKELQAGLAKFKDHFTKLKAENWSPDKQEILVDMAFFPIAVKAENARNPELNLHLFDSNDGVSNDCFKSLMDDVKSGKLQNGRALFKLPRHPSHFIAADIKTIDGKISILVLEPLSLNKNVGNFWQHYAKAGGGVRMSYLLPENAKLTVLSIDALKSDFDCRIHAFSAASKMAKESEFFDEIHKNNLSGQLGVVSEENKDWFMQENKNNGVSFKIEFVKKPASSSNQEIENNEQADSSLSTATALNKDQRQPELLFVFPNVRIIDAHCLLPASFQKHTQAMSSLEKLTDEKLTEPVNKKKDTLLSRFDKHAVERYKKIKNNEAGNSQQSRLKPIKFSASIEEKRLTYLDHAIAYLENAPEEEIHDLWSDFKETVEDSDFLSEIVSPSLSGYFSKLMKISDAFSEERKVGPQRK